MTGTGNPQVRVPEEAVDAVDRIKKEHGYPTRGEAVRHALREAGYLETA